MILNTLTTEQSDILGEIANISMGNSATSLSAMLNHRVEITTPNVSVVKRSHVLDDYSKTCIFVQIHYIKGLTGNNVLVLQEDDVKIMTDLMMGGPGNVMAGELSELHLSAVAEAMNQMMGSAATSLSSLLAIPTDISTPQVDTVDVESIKIFEKMFENTDDYFVKVAFRMTVGDLIDSTMVHLYPIHFAMEMIDKFKQSAE